jgi:hypothetical protein
MKTITIDEAVNYLYSKYSKYGATKQILTQAMAEGITQFNLSPLGAFNILRMQLSLEFDEHEEFSIEDVMEMYGLTREQAQAEIDNMIKEVAEQGENVLDYIIPHSKPQTFLVAPNAWK